MIKKTLVLLCLVLIGISLKEYSDRNSNLTNVTETDYIPFQENFESVTKLTAEKINNRFIEIYKDLSLISVQDWPTKNVRDNLAIKFNQLVNIHPYLDGAVIARNDGTYFTSNTINKNGQDIDVNVIAQERLTSKEWFKLVENTLLAQDITQQLIGFKVTNIEKFSSPFAGSDKLPSMIFSKTIQLKNVFDKDTDYTLYFFVNTEWLNNILLQAKKELSLFAKETNVILNNARAVSVNENSVIKSISLDNNKVTKGLGWEVFFAATPLRINSTPIYTASNMFPLVVIFFTLTLFALTYFQNDGEGLGSLKKKNIAKVGKLTSEISQVRRKYKNILTNLAKISERLTSLKEEMNWDNNSANIEEINSTLETLNDVNVSDNVILFKKNLESINSVHRATLSTIDNFKNFSQATDQDSLAIRNIVTKIKNTVNAYRIEALNLGLASDSNQNHSLKQLTQDLYELSTSLLNDFKQFESTYNKQNSELSNLIEETVHNLSKVDLAADGEEKMQNIAQELEIILEEQIALNNKIKEEFHKRKNREIQTATNIEKLESTLSTSLETLDKEKRKIEMNEQEINSMVQNMQSIRRRPEVTH